MQLFLPWPRGAGEGPSHRSETAEWPQKDPRVAPGGLCREWGGSSWLASLEIFFSHFLWGPAESFACLLSDTAFIFTQWCRDGKHVPV